MIWVYALADDNRQDLRHLPKAVQKTVARVLDQMQRSLPRGPEGFGETSLDVIEKVGFALDQCAALASKFLTPYGPAPLAGPPALQGTSGKACFVGG